MKKSELNAELVQYRLESLERSVQNLDSKFERIMSFMLESTLINTNPTPKVNDTESSSVLAQSPSLPLPQQPTSDDTNKKEKLSDIIQKNRRRTIL